MKFVQNIHFGQSQCWIVDCYTKCLNCFSSDHPCIDQFTNLVFCIFIFMTIASLYFLYLNAVGLFILCEGFIVSINCLCRRSCPVHSSLSDLSLQKSLILFKLLPSSLIFSQFYIGFRRKRLHPPSLNVLFFSFYNCRHRVKGGYSTDELHLNFYLTYICIEQSVILKITFTVFYFLIIKKRLNLSV